MKSWGIYLIIMVVTAGVIPCLADVSWRTKLEQELPLLGHRNWIVVADAAYPWQTAKGIETVCTEASQLDVVKAVLEALSKTKHVRPTVYTDAELDYVAEQYARGISAYRKQLGQLLAKRPVQSLPHEQIIKQLDEAGNTFHVLLLKTKLTLPYTSVFFQLDCGYWSEEAEQHLRESIRAAGGFKARAQ